jgi:hypothetical protein
MTLGFVQRIGDARSLSLEQQSVISRRTYHTADDRGEDGNNEIVVRCGKHLAAIENGREQSWAKVSSRINSLLLLLARLSQENIVS